jgi:hypothetical protein
MRKKAGFLLSTLFPQLGGVLCVMGALLTVNELILRRSAGELKVNNTN